VVAINEQFGYTPALCSDPFASTHGNELFKVIPVVDVHEIVLSTSLITKFRAHVVPNSIVPVLLETINGTSFTQF
jgi:hypothetical protein